MHEAMKKMKSGTALKVHGLYSDDLEAFLVPKLSAPHIIVLSNIHLNIFVVPSLALLFPEIWPHGNARHSQKIIWFKGPYISIHSSVFTSKF